MKFGAQILLVGLTFVGMAWACIIAGVVGQMVWGGLNNAALGIGAAMTIAFSSIACGIYGLAVIEAKSEKE